MPALSPFLFFAFLYPLSSYIYILASLRLSGLRFLLCFFSQKSGRLTRVRHYKPSVLLLFFQKMEEGTYHEKKTKYCIYFK